MKVDTLNMMQIILFLICISSFFSFIRYSRKKAIIKLNQNIPSYIFSRALSYFRKLLIEDYICFEKYGLWRFTEIY